MFPKLFLEIYIYISFDTVATESMKVFPSWADLVLMSAPVKDLKVLYGTLRSPCDGVPFSKSPL